MSLHLSRRHRIRLVIEGALVGILVGMLIAAYRFALSHAEQLLRWATGQLGAHALGIGLWVGLLALACLLVGRLMLFEPYTQGSGIPQVDAEVTGRINMPWSRVLPVKFLEGSLCALAGLSLGREGPSVLLGAMGGKGVSRLLHNERRHERLLITCGAASGMSAAFHAPLTGVLFAIEEIHKEFSAALVISVMVSSVCADYVSSQLLGIDPLIHFVSFSEIPRELYWAVLLMGVVCGAISALHNLGMFWLQDSVFGRMSRFLPYARLAIPFALAGVAAFVVPDLMCGGDALIERVVDAPSNGMPTLLLLLVGKYVFTAICFASGAPGGTLLPLVVMGSLTGAIYGMGAMALVGMPVAYENGFIALGIAGLFSGVIQAPVTAVVLVFELTGTSRALLATSVVSIVAYVTSTLLKSSPFYEHLYARLLGDTLDDSDHYEESGNKALVSYVVGAGSAVEGRLVSEVSWPEHALLLTVSKAGLETVAHGDTQLEALDEICVLMDGDREFEHDLDMRRLCAGSD